MRFKKGRFYGVHWSGTIFFFWVHQSTTAIFRAFDRFHIDFLHVPNPVLIYFIYHGGIGSTGVNAIGEHTVGNGRLFISV